MSDIRDYVHDAPLFDTHEHLFGFDNMNSQRDTMLYKEVMECYANNAVATAHGAPLKGLLKQELDGPGKLMDYFSFMRNEGNDDLIFDVWDKVRFTGYGQGINISSREVFGMEYTKENASAISDSMRQHINESGADGFYEKLLDSQKIIGIINSAYWVPLMSEATYLSNNFPRRLTHTLDLGQTYTMVNDQPIQLYEQTLDRSLPDLAAFDSAMQEHTEAIFRSGYVTAHKIGIAYSRYLDVEDENPSAASDIYDKIRRGVPVDNHKPLHDYLVHKALQRSEALNMPVQVHTGLLAGSYTNVFQGDPSHMVDILRRYRNVRFDIFHSSWPHSEALSAIALAFPNVWIDMCWAWTINPVQMERNLSEWLGCVPFNKIFAFGGDTSTPINTVGYAIQARNGVANVMEDKVRRGVFSPSDAREVADALLWKNATGFFNYEMPEFN